MSSVENYSHIPVMINEVIQNLPEYTKGGIVVDATFGLGGYTRAILKNTPYSVIGIDQDPDVKPLAEELMGEYPDRFLFVLGNFREIDHLVPKEYHHRVRSIIFDIGVSSYQLDSSDRGFSFSKEAPLDMRMGEQQHSAADVINTLSAEKLADIFYHYGEEPKSRQIASYIVRHRDEAPITTTTQLAKIACKFYPGFSKKHPATRIFQALRIHVNDELNALVEGIQNGLSIVEEGSLQVVTFHSLEDRIVKRVFQEIQDNAQFEKSFSITIRRPNPLKPKKDEVDNNPRARSAKLRVLDKMVSNNE